jgi:hypothetical protein
LENHHRQVSHGCAHVRAEELVIQSREK